MSPAGSAPPARCRRPCAGVYDTDRRAVLRREVAAGLAFNAAGPFVADVGRMIGYDLPVYNVLRQK